MNAGKESGIELKGQESGSPCDAFILLHIMFLCVEIPLYFLCAFHNTTVYSFT